MRRNSFEIYYAHLEKSMQIRMIEKIHKDKQKETLDEIDEVIQIDKNLFSVIKSSADISNKVMTYCCIRVKRKGIFIFNKSARLLYEGKESKRNLS